MTTMHACVANGERPRANLLGSQARGAAESGCHTRLSQPRLAGSAWPGPCLRSTIPKERDGKRAAPLSCEVHAGNVCPSFPLTGFPPIGETQTGVTVRLGRGQRVCCLVSFNCLIRCLRLLLCACVCVCLFFQLISAPASFHPFLAVHLAAMLIKVAEK